MNSGDTIVAPATPLGFSGLAVVRVSGPSAFKFAEIATHKKILKNRSATLVTFYNKKGEKIDRAVITRFVAPASYSGEDMVEISSHGNPTIVDAVVSTFCSLGARLADPGEFTYRAFINGKMDLVQAEGVAALIKSKTIESVKEQQKIISGSLSKQINKLRLKLVDLVSFLEYQMDISEEDLSAKEQKNVPKKIRALHKEALVLSNTFIRGKMLNLGVTAVITGPPNVGKSSLLNALCGESRAIVSPEPGTTRDIVRSEMVLGGVPFVFLDTAGIRVAKSAIEQEGVARAKKLKEKADLIISVSDDPQAQTNKTGSQPHIFVVNKSDLHSKKPNKAIIHISCKNKTGLEVLLLEIKSALKIGPISSDASLLSTPRQSAAINACAKSLERAQNVCKTVGLELELVSFELRSGINALDVLLGKTTPEDIINNIFNNLCVGK